MDLTDERLSQTVAKQIQDIIEFGAFEPGSRLPGERSLAQKFDVSRSSVREALMVLQAQGQIKIKHGSGAYVCGSPNGKRASTLPNRSLSHVDPIELIKARAVLESAVVGLAATQITDKALVAMEIYFQAMVDADESSALSQEEADRLFHLTIAQATQNPALIYLTENMWLSRHEGASLPHIYQSVCHANSKVRAQEHRNILDALKSNDPEAARKAMNAHFERIISAVSKPFETRSVSKAHMQSTQEIDAVLNV